MDYVNLYLKNIYSKGYTIERIDTSVVSILLNKDNFNESLRIILPQISDSILAALVKEVTDRGSRTIQVKILALNMLHIWIADSNNTVNSPGNDITNTTITKANTPNFSIRARVFFQSLSGDYYLQTVDSDGSPKWVKDDPSRYNNVIICEQPILPLLDQQGF